MTKRNAGILLLIVIAISLAIYFWFARSDNSSQASGRPPAVISSARVEQVNWRPALESAGSIVAVNDIQLSTEVNGMVSEIIFQSGQPVDKGNVIIKLDDAVDIAALDALSADQRLAEIQFRRAKDLLKKRVMSQSEYDEASARFDAAKARVKQQQAIISRKRIIAPFSGIAGIRQVSLGEYIEAGQPIVSLQSIDPVYVDYSLPERYVSRLQTGQLVQVKVDAMPERVFEGRVIALNSGIERGTRSLRVRALLENPEALLRAGMFAQIKTITAEAEEFLVLPRTSISFNPYGNYVYIIRSSEQGNTVERMAVELGEVRDGLVVIKGLPAGTEVVRTGLVKLRDGMAVKIDNQVSLNDAEISGE